MGELRISVETTPAREDVAVLEAGLTAHTLPIIGTPGFKPLAVFLRDSAGHVVAGAYGRTNWNWLHISTVWVAETERGKGFGRELILAIEAAAEQRGCRQAHLDTFSYQARPFYERLGYRVFGELEDYPTGHARFFLRKQLHER
jgi:GNAT superfamily N-acetyltransferase